MALSILILSLGFECVFAFCCIRSKSLHGRIRSFVRIGALPAFIVSVLASAAGWSFRWYPLAALLLILAVLGCITLLTKMAKPYTPGRAVLRAIALSLLIAAALAPALVFTGQSPLVPTGPCSVATMSETYTDQSRTETYSSRGERRRLTVQFWYPEDTPAKSCPLVLFSHGSFGVRTSNESLFMELASHGYVVCSIDHTYQCLYTTDNGGRSTLMDMGYLGEVSREDAHTDRQQSYAYYQKWMALRTGDINFVIDTALAKASGQNAADPYKLIDAERIAVIGHSLGGSAALGVGRMRGDVGAVIALESPFLCDITDVSGDGFNFIGEPYPVPVLTVYSDSSWSHLAEWTQYEKNQKLLDNPGGNASHLHIAGAWHLDLTDLSRASPFLAEMLNGGHRAKDADSCLRLLNSACLEFLDRHLARE